MFRICTAVLILTLSAVSAKFSDAQCSTLSASSTTDELAGLLRSSRDVPEDQRDRECINFALQQLSYRRAPEAAPILVDYLDFQRPLTEAEEAGAAFHGGGRRSIAGMYPATGALMQAGQVAVPALLSAITTHDSPLIRRNATFTIMQIYRTQPVEAIQRMKAEEAKLARGTGQASLKDAIRNAVQWCEDNLRAKCESAAAGAGP
jgi:hypothetical protein